MKEQIVHHRDVPTLSNNKFLKQVQSSNDLSFQLETHILHCLVDHIEKQPFLNQHKNITDKENENAEEVLLCQVFLALQRKEMN